MLNWIGNRRYLVAGILAILVYLVGGRLIPGFNSIFGLRSMLVLSAFLGVAAVGETLVVLLGGIDLSVPFIIGFANVIAAQMSGNHVPFYLTVPFVLALAALIGATSGALSSRFKIHPLIVTLGIGNIVQGAVLLETRGFPTGSAPAAVSSFVSIGSHVGPIPFPPLILFWAALSAVVLVMMARTVFGRQVYALGSNPEAARLALVRPVRIWTLTFALSGVFSAIAGILLLGFTGSAFADVGQPYLFQSIGAVVIGGTSMLGGRGNYAGTIIGAFVLIELTTLLMGLGLTFTLVQAALGLVIILLVSLYGREPHVRNQI
jgi:ribose transport system permease protein